VGPRPRPHFYESAALVPRLRKFVFGGCVKIDVRISGNTKKSPYCNHKYLYFNRLQLGLPHASGTANLEALMQLAITSLAVIAGLIFSIAIAILVEEFIFGEVFRLFLAPQAVERIRVRAVRR
jgi:hypothetical protein